MLGPRWVKYYNSFHLTGTHVVTTFWDSIYTLVFFLRRRNSNQMDKCYSSLLCLFRWINIRCPVCDKHPCAFFHLLPCARAFMNHCFELQVAPFILQIVVRTIFFFFFLFLKMHQLMDRKKSMILFFLKKGRCSWNFQL